MSLTNSISLFWSTYLPKGFFPLQKQKSARVLMPPPPRIKGKTGGTKPWNTLSLSNKKVVNKPVVHRNARAPPSNGTDENTRTRSWTSSSHSSEIVKGSSTSDTPQQPRKRKRTRSKKKKWFLPVLQRSTKQGLYIDRRSEVPNYRLQFAACLQSLMEILSIYFEDFHHFHSFAVRVWLVIAIQKENEAALIFFLFEPM